MRPRPSLILTYHSLDGSGSVISITPEQFRSQLAHLASSRTPVVALERLPETPDAVALTFDDGFRNFREHALPALAEFGLPATVFIVSRYCGGRNDWPSQPRGLPCLDLMSWSELEELARAGIGLGAHTATHPFLTRLDEAGIDQQMRTSREEIEQRTGCAVTTFAYPYGDWNEAVRRGASKHFRMACTTDMGFVPAGCDPLALPRVDMYYLRNAFWFERLQTALGAGYVRVRAELRRLRRAVAM